MFGVLITQLEKQCYLLFEGKLNQTVNFSWRTNKHLVVIVEKTFSTLTGKV